MSRILRIVPFIAALSVALAFSSSGLVLAQAQPQMVSAYLAGALPVADPFSPAWEMVPAYTATLTPQAGILPSLLAVTVPSVEVQSLNNGEQIAFRLVWPDAVANLHATKPDEFRDAAALQFAVEDLAADQTMQILCMGAVGQQVNLWHWKADWQYDLDQGFHDVVDAYPNFWLDYYPFVVGDPPFRVPTDFESDAARAYLIGWSAGNRLSDPARLTPVEDLKAGGFGTVTSQAHQDMLGRGQWQDGKWSVVFARDLRNTDADDVQFIPGRMFSLAFAVWDGADAQVGARKQLSTWTTMLLETASGIAYPAPKFLGVPLKTVLAVLGLALVIVVAAVLLARRRRGVRRST